MRLPASMIPLALAIGTVLAAPDAWDLPPLRYSDTPADDAIARLAAEVADGRRFDEMRPLDALRFVLDLLEIPAGSQMLVFSKTSKQNPLIHPGNPRAIYFNEDSYVGYVPGGDIEVITHDSRLGAVFYLVRVGGGQSLRITRDTSDCMSCHGTARTENAPGVLVRSVFPDADGHPILPKGTFVIDHRSPLRERWGGYYVTGTSSLSHLGNRTFPDDPVRSFPERPVQLASLAGRIDTTRYLRPTSDIVALMVLEHQCRVHNLLAAASLEYRRMEWLQQALHREGSAAARPAARHVAEMARKIADALLFDDEADLGEDGITGDPAFQQAFAARFPRTHGGQSLADFHLQQRLFKNRCSYMVYSAAFDSLPERLKSAVLRTLRESLAAPPAPGNHPHIPPSERKRILAILAETVP